AAFIDALNNWYIRRSRDRFWGAGGASGVPGRADHTTAADGAGAPSGGGGRAGGVPGRADHDALDTLYTVLVTLTQVAAPLLPFLTGAMYRGLVGAPADRDVDLSVHRSDWPDVEAFPADPDLVRDMDRVREVCSVGLSLRVERGLRVRLPLAALT